jgi:hypothetical protein
MKRVVFNSQRTILSAVALLFFSFVRPDKEFRIFQFPQHQIPRIDGDFSDWSVVPETYTIGLNELKNTRFGEGKNPDSKDFDLKVKVGWVKGLNRLYFYIDAYDDFWDFKDVEEATAFLSYWCDLVNQTSIQPFKKLQIPSNHIGQE